MKPPYTHLSLDERRELFRLHSARIPMRVIAQRLNRHPSTLYREVKRKWFYDKEPLYRGYFHVVAHEMAHGRRARLSKLSRNQPLAAYVVEQLQAAWSPEQIAGRLQIEPESPGQITHETIYAFVYSPHGKALGLSRHLPMARRQRRTRYARKPRGFTIPLENTIELRPPEIGARTSFGHWEGDLIAFRQDFGKANLTSLVERQSRYAILTRNPDRNATGVVAGVIGKLKALPASARQSVTFDRGTEFARYPLLKSKLGMESYFCKPQAPWQKGSVENTNGRVRRFLSRDTDIAALPEEALLEICDRLNATPRKCLGYRTPKEVLISSLDPELPGLCNPDQLHPGSSSPAGDR
jgi:transposase, IS30 family